MSNTASEHERIRWQFEWRLSLFAAFFITLFVCLGFWQLQRAEEKRAIARQWQFQREQAPVGLAALTSTAAELAYRPVLLSGSFLENRQFLLDNRIRRGRYGVEVISPLQDDSGQLVLVNRGWLAADPTRRELPAIPALAGRVTVQGYIYVPPGDSYLLGAIASDRGWPRLVQAAEVGAMGEMLGRPLFPYIVRLAPDSAGALVADWPLVNARPEKHTAYAFQWFAMALVLLLLFLWRSSNAGELFKHYRAGRSLDR
jgi:cytochrome oxidase assembly protein ShyY1